MSNGQGDRRGEPTAPAALRRMQRAFGEAVARPLTFEDGEGGDYTLQIDRYDLQLLADILPRGQASAAERLGIYNQQYWFRLLTVMQEEYPLLQGLLGTLEFNKLAMAYLARFPSSAPTLRYLSEQLVTFLSQDDHRWHRPMLIESARLEYLFIHAFDAGVEPALDPSALSEVERVALLDAPLSLQPHVSLFEEHWNLVECRRSVRQAQAESAAPQPVEARGWYVVYRSDTQGTTAMPVHQLGFRLLTSIAAGTPLGRAVDGLLGELGADEVMDVAENIRGWFQEWAALGWFTAG